MSNLLTTIGHDIKVGVEDVGKGIEKAFSWTEKLAAVVEEAEELTPEVKQSIETVFSDAEALAVAAAPIIANGPNVAADIVILAPVSKALLKLVSDLKNAFPIIEAAFKALQTAEQDAAQTAPTTTTAAAPAL